MLIIATPPYDTVLTGDKNKEISEAIVQLKATVRKLLLHVRHDDLNRYVELQSVGQEDGQGKHQNYDLGQPDEIIQRL